MLLWFGMMRMRCHIYGFPAITHPPGISRLKIPLTSGRGDITRFLSAIFPVKQVVIFLSFCVWKIDLQSIVGAAILVMIVYLWFFPQFTAFFIIIWPRTRYIYVTSRSRATRTCCGTRPTRWFRPFIFIFVTCVVYRRIFRCMVNCRRNCRYYRIQNFCQCSWLRSGRVRLGISE